MKTYTEPEFKALIQNAEVITDRLALLRSINIDNALFYSLLDDDQEVSADDVFLASDAGFDRAPGQFRVVDCDNNELTVSDLCSIVRDMKKIF